MKDAYYFPHDANARHDTKILALRSVYGFEGYGYYWAIVEMLREASDYRLSRDKYTCSALAMELQCSPEKAGEFLHACIHDLHLFCANDDYFWSESLLRRMERLETIREKRKLAAGARWSKAKDANAMQMQCGCNAVKESKVKESKVKKSRVDDTASSEVPSWVATLQRFKQFKVTDGWIPGIEAKFSGIDLDEAARDFVCYWSEQRKSFKSLQLTFLNFLRKCREWGKCLKVEDLHTPAAFERDL